MEKRMGRSSGKIFGRAMFTVVCALLAATAAYAQTTVPIAPNVTPLPTQQAQRPNSGRPPGYGVLAGYVFWDTNAVKHTPANSCTGVNVSVARGGAIVGTSSANIAYMQTVGAYAVCKYAVKSLPQGLDLQVGVNVASGAFSPAALSEQSKTVNIRGGAGGMCFGPVVPSQTELLGNWQTCPGYAEDVNFVLVPARGLLPSRVAGPVRVAPGTPIQQTGPLMNAGAQQTMLAAQANPLLADGGKQSQGVLNGQSRTAITNSTFTGGIQPVAVPKVGASQSMSATGNAANPRLLAPPQTVAPTDSPSLNGGTSGNSTVVTNSSLSLSGGTNQGTSMTVAPPSPAASALLNTGSSGGSAPGPNSSLQPLMPRSSSNTSSGGTGSMTLKPLIPRGNSSGDSNTGSASGSEKPLANADVLNLLSARTSEQAILDRIRNHPATFDVSNQARASFDRACAGIKHPGVPTSAWATEIKHVWDTMVNVVICQQTNGRGGEGACDLTPLQSLPKNTSAGPTPTDSKVPGRSKYDAITLESGATQDTRFANWANSGQAPNNGSPSTSQVKPAMNAVGAVYGQSGNAPRGNSNACDVTQIRLRIGTGGDDLRGGQDNLNVLIYLTDAKPRVALNVNSSANWPNNSTHRVVIPIKPPVSPDEIKAIRLFHIADGGFNAQSLENGIMATPAAPIQIAKAFQSPDNWDMSGLAASALGNGAGLRIATYGFHRFTGSNPDLVIYVPRRVMARACGTGRPAANGGSGSGGGTGSGLNPALNPGGSGLQPVTGNPGAGSKYGMQRFVPLTVTPATRNSRQQLQNNKLVQPIRVAPGTPVQQPNPGSGALVTSGTQQAMLGAQATPMMAGSSTPPQGAANATSSPIQSAGSISAPRVSPQAAIQRTQVTLDPAAYTAQSCAKDPSFRIVAIMENSSGAVSYVPGYFDTNVNLPPAERTSITTAGHLFTVFGCAFGTGPIPSKAVGGMPVPGHTQASAAVLAGGLPTGADVYAMGGNNVSCCYYTWDFLVRSWTDNAIVISAPVRQDTPLITQMIGVQTAGHYNTYAILWR